VPGNAYGLELNHANVAQLLVEAPFTEPGADRSLQLGRFTGNSFALSPIVNDVGTTSNDLVIDGKGQLYLVRASSALVTVGVLSGDAWNYEDVAGLEDPFIVDTAVAAGLPDGGLAVLVAHVDRNVGGGTYRVSLVVGSAGDWITTPVTSNVRDLSLIGVGAFEDVPFPGLSSTVVAAYSSNGTAYVVQKVPTATTVTPLLETSAIGRPRMAVGAYGDVHLVGPTVGDSTTTHVSGWDGSFTTETLPADPSEQFSPLGVAIDILGTLWFTDVKTTNDGRRVLRIVRHRGARFDLTDVVTFDAASSLAGGAELRLAWDSPHLLVGSVYMQSSFQ
jgi:hypothetical protein